MKKLLTIALLMLVSLTIDAQGTWSTGTIEADELTGETIITITDMEAVRSMVWALFSVFPAVIVVIMMGLLYLYPIKK